MEKYLENKKQQIDALIAELSNAKQETGFEKIIKEYKDNKEKIRDNKIMSKSKDKTVEVEILINENNSLKKRNQELDAKLSKVASIEKKLYLIKKELVKKVTATDKIKNAADYQVKKNELQKEDLTSIIDGKKVADLNKENKSIDAKIKELAKQKEEQEKKELPTTYLVRTTKDLELAKQRNELAIKKIEATNVESVNKRIEFLDKNIETFKEKSEVNNTFIESTIELINAIDDEFTSSHNSNKKASFVVEHLDVWYGRKQALFDVNLVLPKNKVIAIIGPSGCGKSTFLRTLNRINDNIPSFRAKGTILLDGEYDIYKLRSVDNIYDKIELPTLRTKVGMIFQQPNPFPMSIAKNVQYGPRVKGVKNRAVLNELTEQSLKNAGLWEEVKDNLKALGNSLSGGQQQRLCIARAIANEPEILLMDEPTSALDPIATKIIEDLIVKLKKHYTIIMVTHSMQQAQRISDHTAFFYQGELIEFGTTKQIFESPKEKETKDYISGKFG